MIIRDWTPSGAAEFLDVLKELDRRMPEERDVHIFMDNYATHRTPRVNAWLARRPHWHVHFTLIGNLAERRRTLVCQVYPQTNPAQR
ncbi:hypothetical protein SAMN04490248_1632 [Salinihabitans flavidus]|uniref:DDE superfamily endonuclease n=1 Tax=Salinihabitans flavidus TaxID=569882 RepID=A0A1H8WH89_9RHOB|nr:hypothetical protein SAMN04490248_1632 [Salinihabitans flavidus]